MTAVQLGNRLLTPPHGEGHRTRPADAPLYGEGRRAIGREGGEEVELGQLEDLP